MERRGFYGPEYHQVEILMMVQEDGMQISGMIGHWNALHNGLPFMLFLQGVIFQ
jgi:hypothetical protein